MTDTENQQLRQNQHEENVRKFLKLERGHEALMQIQLAQSASLARIEANTSDLPEIKGRLDDLESANDKTRGAMWVVGILFTGWEFVTRILHK